MNKNSKYYRPAQDPKADVENLRQVTGALKDTVEVLTRQRKPVAAAAVTWQDLVDLGLITASQVPTL